MSDDAFARDAIARLEELDEEFAPMRAANAKRLAHWKLCIPGGVDWWVCPTCGASVIAMMRGPHDRWHAELHSDCVPMEQA